MATQYRCSKCGKLKKPNSNEQSILYFNPKESFISYGDTVNYNEEKAVYMKSCGNCFTNNKHDRKCNKDHDKFINILTDNLDNCKFCHTCVDKSMRILEDVYNLPEEHYTLPINNETYDFAEKLEELKKLRKKLTKREEIIEEIIEETDYIEEPITKLVVKTEIKEKDFSIDTYFKKIRIPRQNKSLVFELNDYKLYYTEKIDWNLINNIMGEIALLLEHKVHPEIQIYALGKRSIINHKSFGSFPLYFSDKFDDGMKILLMFVKDLTDRPYYKMKDEYIIDNKPKRKCRKEYNIKYSKANSLDDWFNTLKMLLINIKFMDKPFRPRSKSEDLRIKHNKIEKIIKEDKRVNIDIRELPIKRRNSFNYTCTYVRKR